MVNKDVIKTHPRKGYAWVTDVEQVTEQNTEQNPTTNPEQTSAQTIKQDATQVLEQKNDAATTSTRPKTFPWQQLLIFIIFCAVTVYFTTNNSTTNTNKPNPNGKKQTAIENSPNRKWKFTKQIKQHKNTFQKGACGSKSH